ncbi:RNA polymerase sigma-70 factor [Nocardia aurantiaca]|uniref:RNA polymerase sigma-70 factor n=1 Tax=Nocardia aurantiaca TaxID=2675850 RepID=A0A6I3L2U8_9NOCA|nr:RNA polymerase sigma-70 factor [Nocardia aurantiaca]MTE14935.1 RNA polymerase sigma-70 factor [Nocardia aurantiaca]
MDSDGLVEFERHRPRLFALAYRMLGSAAEAEDAVQETYLRWDATDRAEIRSAEAWLTTILVNLCRTWLDSARARRETYVGPWLPEPVRTGHGELGPLESAEQRELVSMAMLTMLERLTPAERAVFVLREAFGYAHREIADMLDLSVANSQQLYRRATRHVRQERPRFDATPDHVRALFEKFLGAAQSGDVAALESMFTADIVSTADGGGKFTAARRPVVGAGRVAHYIHGLVTRLLPGFPDVSIDFDEVNGGPAVVFRTAGAVLMIATIDVVGDRISALRMVLNPDKLAFFARAEQASTGGSAA